MKMKVLSLLLCGLLACSTLTACGGSDNSAKTEVGTAVEKVSEEDDSSNQGKTSATILDSVKYVCNDDDHEMMESAKAYLANKGITYQDDGSRMVSTLSDDFLGYRAYYGWDYDDYFIYLTFDSEDELKQAVSDVRDYLSSRADPDFEGTDFCKAVEEEPSRWEKILDWYENGEVFCTDYSQDDEIIYIEAISFDVIGGLSRLRTETEAEYILGDCESYIVIMVAGRPFGINTDFGVTTDDGKVTADTAEAMNNVNEQLQSSDVADWKQTYADYFLNYSDYEINGYDIYDVNNDGIPEIFGSSGGMYPYLFYINASGEVEELGLGKYPSILDSGRISSESIVAGDQHDSVYLYNDATKKFELIFEGYVKDCNLETATYFISEEQCDADEYNRQFKEAADGEAIYCPVGHTSGGVVEIADAILSY